MGFIRWPRRKVGWGRLATQIKTMLESLGYKVMGPPCREYIGWGQRVQGAYVWSAPVRSSTTPDWTQDIGSQWTMRQVLKAHREGCLKVQHGAGGIHLDVESEPIV